MYRHQLALKVRSQFGDFQTGFIHNPFDFIGVGLALRCLFYIDQPAIPRRDLNPLIT
jgi:hypothetical protein